MSIESEARRLLAISDLEDAGPPVRLRDLCALTGFTKTKFYDAIESGELPAKWIRTGQTKLAVVERRDALRYLTDIGFAA